MSELREILMDALREVQGDQCGICGRRAAAADTFHLDHDHTTGMIRGYLCRVSNLAEGRHGDQCAQPELCPTCTWRMTPAVTWVGWTVQAKQGLEVLCRFRTFQTSQAIAEKRTEWSKR